MVKKLSISDKTKTILSLESAFTDVLTIVIFLVLVDSFASGIFKSTDLFVGIGPKTLIALLMGTAGGLIWAFLKKKYPQVVNMHFAGEAWAILVYGLIESTKHNGALGVLALGFMLANLDLLPRWFKKFPVLSPHLLLRNEPFEYNDVSFKNILLYLLGSLDSVFKFWSCCHCLFDRRGHSSHPLYYRPPFI